MRFCIEVEEKLERKSGFGLVDFKSVAKDSWGMKGAETTGRPSKVLLET